MKEFFKTVFKLTFTMLLVIAVILGIVFVFLKINNEDIDISEFNPFDGLVSKETKNILVAALHTEGPLTDFIMVVQYNPVTKRAVGLSIPRDTKVIGSIDGKINSAYAKRRDINDLVERVKEVTSLEIDNYVLLETSVVAKMIDEIGGITYDVPFDMKYDDNSQNLHINILKGKQTLNGQNVVKLLRFRKNNEGTIAWGDIQRIDSQQKFIKAAIPQIIAPKNIIKMPELIKLALSLVKTDLQFDEIIGYVDDVAQFNMENLRMEMLPGEAKYIDGVSYYVSDTEKTLELIDEMFFNDTPGVESITENTINSNEIVKENIEPVIAKEIIPEVKKEDLTIEVLNATTRNGLAAKVAQILKDEGYNVTRTGNYKTSENKKTTIINRSKSEEFAKDIKSILNQGIIKTEEKTELVTDITVIVGTNY